MATKKQPVLRAEDIEKLHWELVNIRYLRLKNDSGHSLYEGRFLSEVVRRRRGRFEVKVFFYARKPLATVRQLLASGACPADLHGVVLD